jgi:bacteriorhodopsin
MWQLFAGLGASINSQPENVRELVKKARLLTFASWGFYPIVYMIPYTNLSGSDVTVGVQVGYTIADLIAKAGVGVLIYMIAVRKSQAEYGDKT